MRHHLTTLWRFGPCGFAVAWLVGLSLPVAGEMRSWTSSDGKVVEAEFVGLAEGQVKIKMADGREFTLPMERFSEADQAYARKAAETVGEEPTDGAMAGGGEGETVDLNSGAIPQAEKTWPRGVAIADKPVVEVVIEDTEAKRFVYRSPHYEFECDSKLGANVVREFGRLFEATYLLNCKLPLDWKPEPEPLRKHFLAKLFTNRQDYINAGGSVGSAGIYSSGKKALMVPLSSLGVKMVGSRVSLDKADDGANGTLIHEITHQMMNHWLGRLPKWFVEGSADYTELLDYNTSGRFSWTGIRKNLQNMARIKNLYEPMPFKMLDLQELMEISSADWSAALTKSVKAPKVAGGSGKQSSQNYGSACLLTYYFYHLDGEGDGANVISWVRALETAERGTDKIELIREHLLRGRSYAQLAEDVKKGLKRAGVDIVYDPPGKNYTVAASD
jgi:hypothetical protein